MRRSIAVLGARGVGKTAITRYVAGAGFGEDYAPTIEETHLISMEVDGIPHEVTVLDTAGQNEHSILSASYTVGVDGYVLLFNIASMESFETIKRVNEKLMTTLRASASAGTSEVPRALVGNQLDREKDGREVPEDTAREYAKSIEIPYMECSARTGSNVEQPFIRILQIAYHNWQRNSYMVQEESENKLPILKKSNEEHREPASDHGHCVLQ